MMISVMLYHLHTIHLLESVGKTHFQLMDDTRFLCQLHEQPAFTNQIVSDFKMTISRFLVETEGQ